MTAAQQGHFVLISGANRGIGFSLIPAVLERTPSAVIFAGARDPANATELNDLAKKHPNVRVIKLVADDEESNKQAVEEVNKVTDRLDVVVANAGIAFGAAPVHTDASSTYKQTFEVNTLGPLKVAVNYLALAMHHQTEDVGAVVIPYHPDPQAYSHIPNMPRAITPEQSAREYVDLIDRSTREEHGGKFWGHGSTEPLPW
ncbi:hypothetical protein QFC19_003327 [Naganishia cerealis]|uniref:Uncharacterized protein n=1 Tax=Naganishia cerealis TaxID=610337 RepID=A0ACC2W5V9_9TREE|nr:hypothetical protein QFC19_003327 [Naganishia cerealis]